MALSFLSLVALKHFWANQAFILRKHPFWRGIQEAAEVSTFCWRIEHYGVLRGFDAENLVVLGD